MVIDLIAEVPSYLSVQRRIAPTIGWSRQTQQNLADPSRACAEQPLGCINASSQEKSQRHHAGRACRATRINQPIVSVYSEECPSYKEAFRREHQV
jgi:hypothetical protein